MKSRKLRIATLVDQLDIIAAQAAKATRRYDKDLKALHPAFRESGANLLHYLALRQFDMREAQSGLGDLGLSRLSTADAHVLASITAVKRNLALLAGRVPPPSEKPAVTIRGGAKRLKGNTVALLGRKIKGSAARIMVTLPTEAAYDRDLVRELLASGMNCARINCAHDDEDVWARMIENVRRVQKKTGRACRICMDLAGPKLRTGNIKPGPCVVHFSPTRDAVGSVVVPARVGLSPDEETSSATADPTIPLPGAWLDRLSVGSHLRYRDARGKRCSLDVVSRDGRSWIAVARDSSYVVPGVRLAVDGERSRSAVVGALPPIEQTITLAVGDILVLHRDPEPGEPACYDEMGNLLRPAHVSCTLPEVFGAVERDETVLLDDGKIAGKVVDVADGEIHVEITSAREGGERLRADKGINLPESDIELSGLTRKDRVDLEFVARHADVVNMSFVNGPRDVRELYAALDEIGADSLGVVLKIETQRGFDNLPAILLAAMRRHPIGVMLARGDLAVEVGWRNLAEVQHEILSLCEAAHVPVVWATQVLETLAKKGRPSRAEISDASMAQQAECVMLNKGPHIPATIRMLEQILKSMEKHRQKKSSIKSVLRVRQIEET